MSTITPTNNDLSCYDSIIGLSRTPCTCYPDNPFSISLSDKYLDEVEGMENVKQALQSAESCDFADIWEQMYIATEQGKISFISDANIKLQELYQLKRQHFKGAIGMATAQRAFNPNVSYAGARMFCANVVSGYMKIKGIGMYFDTTGQKTVEIWNNLNQRVARIENLNTDGGKHRVNNLGDDAVILPLHSPYVSNLEYYFLYHNDHILPFDNEVKKSCCGQKFSLKFNRQHPYFDTQTGSDLGWIRYAMIGGMGVTTGDLGTFNFAEDTSITAPDLMNGLTLDIEFYCNANEVFCKDELDFATDPFALKIADAIRYKAAFYLVHFIKNNKQVNYQTLINQEENQDYSVWYDNKYNEILAEITKGIDYKKTDCFVCRGLNKIKTGSIFR